MKLIKSVFDFLTYTQNHWYKTLLEAIFTLFFPYQVFTKKYECFINIFQ